MPALRAAGPNRSIFASTARFQPYCHEHARSFKPLQVPYGFCGVKPVLSVLFEGQVVICEITSPGFAVFTYNCTFGCVDPVLELFAHDNCCARQGLVVAAVP